MKTFLAVYTGSPGSREAAGWDALNEEQRRSRQQEGVDAWERWVAANRDAIADGGGPLGKTKRVSRDGIEDVTNNIAAYVVVRAESHAAAAQLFAGHPHFTIFPGDGVEIMECLPVPTA